MTGHDHTRPDVADQRAVLAIARALLDGASHREAAKAVRDGSCPVCIAVTGIGWGFGVAAQARGESGLGLTEKLRAQLAAMIAEAEAELDTGLN
jgi:hypothetical protein